MKLTKKTIAAIRKSGTTVGMLMDSKEGLDCSYSTILRYLENNDIMLTTATALAVIEKQLGISPEDAIEKEEVKK